MGLACISLILLILKKRELFLLREEKKRKTKLIKTVDIKKKKEMGECAL